MTVDAEPGGAAVLRAKHQRGVVRPDHGEVGAFGERLVEGTGGDRLSEPGDLVLVAEHRAIPGDGGDVVSLRAHLYRRGEDARFDHCGASLTGEPAGAGSSFGSSVGSGSGGGSDFSGDMVTGRTGRNSRPRSTRNDRALVGSY